MNAAGFDRVRGLKALRRAGAGEESSASELLRDPKAIRAQRERMSQVLGATAKKNQYGEHLSLHCWTGEVARCTPEIAALRLLAPEGADAAADPEKWLFLDTETTGLAGGSGTYAFLVGVAWWDGGGLEIEQFFMRECSEERSLLLALAERIAERSVLVTFNGKSFDWPLLETRYRMSRRIPVPSLRAHLDFLHSARNLWRLRLGSVKLSQLERHVLGWDRGADRVSETIPQAYLDFVRGGSPERLVPVFNHNQMDLRGLAALSGRVLSLLSDAENVGQDGLELFGVSQICERRGESGRARKLYEKSIASSLPVETDRSARRSLARIAKREGDFDAACEHWKSALGNSRHGYEAYRQLAIYHEHTASDPERALQVVQQALNELRRAYEMGDLLPRPYRELKDRFEHRKLRLERKRRKSMPELRWGTAGNCEGDDDTSQIELRRL